MLAIRRAANVHHGKLPPTARDEDLADVFDAHARIGLLYAGGAPAGSVRVCSAGDRFPCDLAGFPGFAEATNRLGGFVTGSRLAVLPRFQGGELFHFLHDVMPAEAEKTGRKFVVIVATGWVLEKYVTLGWERTGLVFPDPDFGGMPHEFLVLDVAAWRRRNTLIPPPEIGSPLQSAPSLRPRRPGAGRAESRS